jgi:hypothetical protein
MDVRQADAASGTLCRASSGLPGCVKRLPNVPAEAVEV